MDSGLAAIIGASIGSGVTLLASVVTPWIRETLDRRRRLREERSVALFGAIRDVLMAASTLKFRNGSLTVEHALALHEALVVLDLHLGPDEYPISNLAVRTATLVRMDDPGAGSALAALQYILPRWRAGVIKIEDVRSTYSRLTEAFDSGTNVD